jgi:hypothetical protein
LKCISLKKAAKREYRSDFTWGPKWRDLISWLHRLEAHLP